ncbi:MAG: helix-turn-helix domain-containing protein [Ruminococcus flavefaciens]|nr:helix-turn-helix domain-containing protein [Ruminococcus flavefaciens]
MDKVEMLGNNIRCLRIAYGETQEQLGDAINVAKNTVSSYEKGRTEPDKDILSLIAEHYMVSVEELLSYDFSRLDKIIINQNRFWEQIDVVFPIISSENAIKNEHFKKAYYMHREFFSELQKQNLDNIDNGKICFEEYMDAFDDENSREEAAANLTGLWYLWRMIILTPKVMKNQPVALQQLKSKDSKIKRIIEDADPNFEKEADNLINEFNNSGFNEILLDFIKILINSSILHELGNYYFALRFLLNLVDNDMKWEFNRRIAIEILCDFALLGNPYAKRFLLIQECSQIVDDRS